ncbi:MAG: LysR family transcriptional regulator [Candidatus Hydrogenedentes bacterium]|nr:LysR family transcriptional regulator [Candidatus Hydrogenedentota bacterium]
MKQSSTPLLHHITPGVRLWLSLSNEGVFGRGKWLLLDAIHKRGSLQAAANALDISYRKAWGDLRKAEQALGILLVERHRGGRTGGDSSLTPEGKRWWQEYARFQEEVNTQVEQAFAQWVKRMEQE